MENIKDSLLDNFDKDLENIKNQVFSSLESLLKKYNLNLNFSENIEKDKSNPNKLIFDIYKKIDEEITNKLKNIKKEITSRIDGLSQIFQEKIKNIIKKYSNEDNSSITDSKDIFLSESFDTNFNFNEYYANSNSSHHEENNVQLKEKIHNIYKAEKNNFSGNINYNSSDNINILRNSLFYCSEHYDRPAEYMCSIHCQKKFCRDCFMFLGYKSEHGKIIKIK